MLADKCQGSRCCASTRHCAGCSGDECDIGAARPLRKTLSCHAVLVQGQREISRSDEAIVGKIVHPQVFRIQWKSISKSETRRSIDRRRMWSLWLDEVRIERQIL